MGASCRLVGGRSQCDGSRVWYRQWVSGNGRQVSVSNRQTTERSSSEGWGRVGGGRGMVFTEAAPSFLGGLCTLSKEDGFDHRPPSSRAVRTFYDFICTLPNHLTMLFLMATLIMYCIMHLNHYPIYRQDTTAL